MAIGDPGDQLARVKRLLPQSWFGGSSPLLDAVLSAIAAVNSFLYGLIQYAQLQTRILSATGGWLDLISSDFFGLHASRASGQSDASFRNAIIVNLFRPRATRSAVKKVLVDLTGKEPIIFEPSRPLDTGGYAKPCMGYGQAGRYGSMLLPFQAFITAYRPDESGIPNVAGYGISTAGYSDASQGEYASLSMITDVISDDEIFAAIDAVKPVGTIMWVRIGNTYDLPSPAPSYSLLLGIGPVYFGTQPIRVLGIV